jgi:hypothetical protein
MVQPPEIALLGYYVARKQESHYTTAQQNVTTRHARVAWKYEVTAMPKPDTTSTMRRGRPAISRPDVRLPPGYSPNSSLPPGYKPPRLDLQATGATLRSSGKTPMSRRQVLWLALVGTGIVVAIMVIATLALSAIFVQSTVGSAETTLDTYYSALRTQDYTRAYNQLAPALKAAQSQTDYTSRQRQLDLLNGAVVKFTIQSSTVNGKSAMATVEVDRGVTDIQATLDTVMLAQVNDTWYIQSITSHATTPSTPQP